MNSTLGKLVCRKCNGQHLTLKCDKNKIVTNINIVSKKNDTIMPNIITNINILPNNDNTSLPDITTNINIIPNENTLTFQNPNSQNNNLITNNLQNNLPNVVTNINIIPKKNYDMINNINYNNIKYDNYIDTKKLTTVKISDLPDDITEDELWELVTDWGNIMKIRVNHYDNNNIAYLDFKNKNEAEYFVEALDRTPFDSVIINAMICE
jgi:hypothetical protein